jgi:murein DD-endopeptidase MepM/ murein hydrolase activator NlpD
MAVIDAKKLLPSSKSSSAIANAQKPFLVPISNIAYKKDVNLSQKLLKPSDDTENGSGGSLVVLKKKILKIEDIINNTYLIQQSENNRKRKEKERKRFEEREKKLEAKPNADPKSLAKVSFPGQSILDTIKRFVTFTFVGFLVNKYLEYLPKLVEFGKNIEPITKFIDAFSKNVIDGVINFIDLGYRAYDKVNKMIEDVGGKDASKQFEKFSSELNKLLNGAIMASMLIASTAPKGSKPGGAAGSIGANVSRSLGGITGGYGAGTGMTPNRYRMPGQAKVGGFALEQARRGLTFEQSVAAQQASKQVATQTAKQSMKSLVAVPLVGSLIGFIIDTVVFREKPSRAAAGAIGSAIGQGIGIALAGSTTFGLGAGIGMFVGGFAGDWLGKTIYDALNGYKQEPIKAKAQGGAVSSGQSAVSPTRKIKVQKVKRSKKYIPKRVEPGRDIGGKRRIEGLYGADNPGERSALRALKKSSEDLKKMKSMNGVAGGMLGAGVDMALGQKPDRNLANSLGNMFGSVVEAAVNAELNSSFNDISKSIAMANGGVVPSREIGSGMSIGEKIGRYISNAFSIALESSASKVLQNLNQELNLKGGIPGLTPEGDGGGPLTQSQQEAFEKIRKIAERVGSPNPSVTAAIAMLETGWLSNPDSVYFKSKKTNPFGQTGRGPKGFVIGKDGQEHAIYNSLEEGVKAHVDRWKSSYIGKTPAEIIESIRTGKGVGAPGMYNVSPSWASKVLSAYQSGTQPQPSSTPSRGAAAAVLPRGNPVFTSGFGFRNTGIPGASTNHRGIDIGVDPNSPVTALSDGEVIDIYKNFGGHGDAVVVKQSDGSKIVYGHVISGVRKGALIKKGQTIARVKYWPDPRYPSPGGRTHLHLERHVGGAAQDPTGFLNSILQQKQNAQRQASIAPVKTSIDIESIQQDTSYTVVHDVNNIVMPLIPA